VFEVELGFESVEVVIEIATARRKSMAMASINRICAEFDLE
jgi:hypothetical protein